MKGRERWGGGKTQSEADKRRMGSRKCMQKITLYKIINIINAVFVSELSLRRVRQWNGEGGVSRSRCNRGKVEGKGKKTKSEFCYAADIYVQAGLGVSH